MLIDRRALLQLVGLGGVAVAAPAWAGPGQAPAGLVVLRDLPGALSADELRAVLSPFVQRAVPVGLATVPALAADDPRAGILRRALAEEQDLLELVPQVPDLAAMKPYFQMRAASDAVAAAEAWLGAGAGGLPHGQKPVSLASTGSAAEEGLNGVRAAGIRNLLVLSGKSETARAGACPGPVVCARGGLVHRAGQPLAPLRRALDRALTAELAVLVFDPGAGTTGPADAEEIAALIRARTDEGRLAPILPRELILRNDPDFLRLIALRLDTPGADDPAGAAGFAALAGRLSAAGIAFSVTLPEGGAPPPGVQDICAVIAPGDAPPTRPDGCLVLRAGAPGADLAPLLGRALMGGGHAGGLDGAGVLHLEADLTFDAQTDPGAALAALGPVRDAVLIIGPEAYATPARRNALVAALSALEADPASQAVTLHRFATALAPPDPVFDHLRKARDWQARAAPRPGPLSRAERAALMADAQLAWSYIERLTHPLTGLCPSTAMLDDGGGIVSFDRLTMWDLGSLIHALVSARALGLIGEEAFSKRAETILENLPVAAIGGHLLPRGEISTAHPWLGTVEFNACDTGRLLSALHALRHAAPGLDVAGAVARWNLKAMLRDGRVYSYRDGRRRDNFLSHCTPYAVRAFGLWGLAAESPYDVMQGETETDAQMALLYRAAEIGALGAEPLLFEPMEMGATPASTFLADLLFAAQLRGFHETGQLISASEGPLPEAPWFSYQGLRLDAPGDRWEVVTVTGEAQYRTEAFRKANRMISCKAAYLWAALHPHPYAHQLVNYVRANGRVDGLGFASGIYAETGTPTIDYSDINTNGVILQAIAHALAGNPAGGE